MDWPDWALKCRYSVTCERLFLWSGRFEGPNLEAPQQRCSCGALGRGSSSRYSGWAALMLPSSRLCWCCSGSRSRERVPVGSRWLPGHQRPQLLLMQTDKCCRQLEMLRCATFPIQEMLLTACFLRKRNGKMQNAPGSPRDVVSGSSGLVPPGVVDNSAACERLRDAHGDICMSLITCAAVRGSTRWALKRHVGPGSALLQKL